MTIQQRYYGNVAIEGLLEGWIIDLLLFRVVSRVD